MSASLVGSEMCIRDRLLAARAKDTVHRWALRVRPRSWSHRAVAWPVPVSVGSPAAASFALASPCRGVNP
eukprot:813064-Alexandrium_andersonii.AAC.1